MDQKKIGGFISFLRKEKGITQQELGGCLGVTNKTVSRWETGKYMPDISIIPDLCQCLGVSVNELIFGERLGDAYFQKQADINILDMLKSDKKLRRQKFLSEMFGGAGTGLVLSVLYAPDTTRKAVVAVIGCIMIFCGWYYRARLEKSKISLNIRR